MHILADTVLEQHFDPVLFDTGEKVLKILLSSCRNTIGQVSGKSERKITGRISGIAMWFQNITHFEFIQIWCGARQPDTFLQSAYTKMGDEAFNT